MISYKKVPYENSQGDKGFRYIKDGIFTRESRIPPVVLERLEITDHMDYDEQPDKRRCIFCDAPQERQKYFNGQLYDLCEWHYQHMTLGKVAAQVALNAKESADRIAKEKALKESKKKKTRKRKTVLSTML